MIIYCDIDFTIADAWPRIKRWTLPQWPGDSIDPRAFTDEEVIKDEPITGAVKALKKLSNYYDIYYLTARGWKTARTVTRDWLEKYEFPYAYLRNINTVERMIDKIKFFIERKCDLYIDDFTTYGHLEKPIFQKDIVSMIESLGIKVEVFKNNWKEIAKKYG
jgi:5'(3')-deoxyribonucleotidase